MPVYAIKLAVKLNCILNLSGKSKKGNVTIVTIVSN